MTWLVLVSGDRASLESLVYYGIVLMMLSVHHEDVVEKLSWMVKRILAREPGAMR